MTRCLYSRLSLFTLATTFLIACGNSKLREPKAYLLVIPRMSLINS